MSSKLHEDYLRFLAYKGALDRYGVNPDDKATDVMTRIDHELATIEKAGFPEYFLIVADLMEFCRQSDIPTGPGRGSVCGSAVAYATGITDVDPLRFGIPFERFLHLDRIAMPDIDLDICQARRGEVIEYLRRKYGADSVAQIITFGTMQARGVVKDLGRVLHVDEHVHGDIGNKYAESLAAQIPEGSGADQVLLRDFIDSDEGRDFYEKISAIKIPYEKRKISYLDQCLVLEGIRRHGSVHAAGVVIADRPLHEIAPLYKRNKDADVTIQYDMRDAEDIGLLKLDVLGLRTVTVLGDAEKLVRRAHPDFRIKDVPLDDKATFDLLCAGDTVAVFQLEGDGITGAVTGVKPDRFEDIVAILALYRPGPMEQLGSYIARKHGEEPVVFPHDDLATVLERTYGLIVYQEQVIGLARVLAGFTPGEADMFRKAIGKKLPELIRTEIEKFSARAIERGYDEKLVKDVGAQIAYFGRYGFNLGHATGYAFITYWTAYLKANFPVEFYAATLNSHIGEADRVGSLLLDVKKHGIGVLPPNINESGIGFTPEEGQFAIRFGLGAVRGLGDAMVQSLLLERDSDWKIAYKTERVQKTKEDGTPYMANQRVETRVPNKPRPFDGPHDFCARLSHIPINVKKALVVAGAFGTDPAYRKQLHEVMEDLNKAAKKGKPYDIASRETLTMSDIELMRLERETMGFYVTAHPLDLYERELARYRPVIDGEFDSLGTNVCVAGIVMDVRTHTAKNGEMAWLKLESGINGLPDITIFNEVWKKVRAGLKKDAVVVVRGKKTKHPKFGWGVQANEVIEVQKTKMKAKRVLILAADADIGSLAALRELCTDEGAEITLCVEWRGRVAIIKPEVRLPVTGATLSAVEDIGFDLLLDKKHPIFWTGGARLVDSSPFIGSGDDRVATWDIKIVKQALRLFGGSVIDEKAIGDDE